MNSCSVPEILRENIQPLLRDLKLKHTWDVHQDSTSRSSSESPTPPPHKRGFCSALIKVWSPFSLSVFFSPSLNRHLNVVEGFECSNDPRGYVVWGLNAPGRVSHGKQALGDGSDKEQFENPS
ncbi:hypothetical protein AMECASPLE_035655 [Ameca splendens]|uniref:Uncharacterized protein n=1 Tax=Ameca splendens TaxID=208324 RepID=A0ABV0ZG85_9TELE